VFTTNIALISNKMVDFDTAISTYAGKQNSSMPITPSYTTRMLMRVHFPNSNLPYLEEYLR
jgi:hypothetical protein